MSIPEFTAGASLYSSREHYRRRTTEVDPRGGNKVIAQAARDAANNLKNLLGFGSVNCQMVEYCTGNMGGSGSGAISCGVKEVCYWLPY
jgi:hypothetical protein